MSFAGFDQLFIDSATHRRRAIHAKQKKLDEIPSTSTTNSTLLSIHTTINTTPVSILTQENATSEITTIPSVNKLITPKKKQQRRKTCVQRLQDKRKKLEERQQEEKGYFEAAKLWEEERSKKQR